MHAFVWIIDAPRISDETVYKFFVERTISAVLPDPESESVLSELVELYQIHCHSRICWKYIHIKKKIKKIKVFIWAFLFR